jgi:hypothetical protein
VQLTAHEHLIEVGWDSNGEAMSGQADSFILNQYTPPDWR